MTAKADNIQADGTYPSTGASLTLNSRGLWGGLLVLGKAPSSFKGDVYELQIEGIPVSDEVRGSSRPPVHRQLFTNSVELALCTPIFGGHVDTSMFLQ